MLCATTQAGELTIETLHLGLTPWYLNSELDAGELCRQAQLAEAWGFDSFWLPESHFSGPYAIPDPMLLLSSIAACTRELKLGTTSYLLPIRNPLLSAEQVAVVDRLSNGRLILGLGRGFQNNMFEAFGVSTRRKREIFDEVLETMKSAWRGEPIANAGQETRLSPLPLQQPHPPLWVAAFGPKALGQAGRLGLPYLASPMETLAELEANHEHYRSAADAAGQALPKEVVVMRVVLISEDRGTCEAVRKALADSPRPRSKSEEPVSVDDWCIVGSAAEVADRVGHYRERLGINHLIAVRPRVGGIPRKVAEESLAALAELHTR